MKKALRVAGLVLAIVLVAVIGFVAYYFLHYPAVDGPAQLTIDRTPARIERGRYLVNHVSICIDCHSVRNLELFAAPVMKGTEGKGGQRFGQEEGLPGTLYASNITPAGIGHYSDGELFRAITSGVKKDNTVLFPLMPYTHFTKMTDEDLYSIIAYVRTLKPIENTVEKSTVDFPVSMFIRAVPQKHVPVSEPDRKNKLEYGRYLVNAALCAACHTPTEKGEPKPGMEFAGGNVFDTQVGIIRTANITPDEETGIGRWTEDDFVGRFKYYAKEEAQSLDPKKVGYYTAMPWTMYAGMTEEDLRAIFTYLRSIPPVKNAVVKFEPVAAK
ncbi:MAG: c-type cytochrome [Acidobacteriota bacterium]